MKRDYLPPTAECGKQTILCGWYKVCKSYNEAVVEGYKHYRETGHWVRAEQIRTTMIGFTDETTA